MDKRSKDKRLKDIRSNGQKVESGQMVEWTKGRMDKRSNGQKIESKKRLKKYDPRCRVIVYKMEKCVIVIIRIKNASSIASFNLFKQQNLLFC